MSLCFWLDIFQYFTVIDKLDEKRTYSSITIALEGRNTKLLLNTARFSDLLQKKKIKTE